MTFGIKSGSVQAVASRNGALFTSEEALHSAEVQRAAGVIAAYATSYRYAEPRSVYEMQTGTGRSTSDATYADAAKLAQLASGTFKTAAADAILYLAERIQAARDAAMPAESVTAPATKPKAKRRA